MKSPYADFDVSYEFNVNYVALPSRMVFSIKFNELTFFKILSFKNDSSVLLLK